MSTNDSTPVKPCLKCGASDRNANGKCKPCTKAYFVAWSATNKEKSRATRKIWELANKEILKAKSSARYFKNRNAVISRVSKWAKDNPKKASKKSSEWAKKHPKERLAMAASWASKNREKVNGYSKRWRAENSEKSKEIQAAWRAANPDKAKNNARSWAVKNPERLKATRKAWKTANPNACLTHSQNRRARKLLSSGNLSKGLAQKLFKLQKGKCPCCALPLGDDFHMDHKMPLALGGSNTDDNIQLLRAICNHQKHAKHPIDFMQERGFLL